MSSPGSNGGNQLNVLIAEVVMVTRADVEGVPPTVTTIGVHPLVVVPSSIQYTDGSRSTVKQTHGSSIITKGGRALRQVTLSGTFGVADRGLGTYTGTGAQRFQRFYQEVVRLSDAVTKDQVNAARDYLRSPLLSAALTALMRVDRDLERTTFTINWYDMWHGIAFEAMVGSFSFHKSHREGGATGNTPYNLQLQEVGPVVTGGIGGALLRGLFESLATWDTINETLRSYTTTSVVDALAAGVNVPLAQLADSLGAFKAQVDGATGVMNGYAPSTRNVVRNLTDAFTDLKNSVVVPDSTADPANGNTTLVGHIGYARQIAVTARQVLDALLVQGPARRVNTVSGAVDWSTVIEGKTLDGLDAVDRIDDLAGVIDAARFQEAVGALYGMSREEYAAFVSSTGSGGRGALASTTPHTVTAFDTAMSLEQTYGVAWDDVLRLNDLLPDEALATGRVLLIPQSRTISATARIDGLPTFASHAGRSAWGRDLWVDLRTNDDGRLLICDGEDVLVQGMNWIVSTFAAELMELRAQTPEVAQEFVLERRIAALILSDRRFVAVEGVTFTRGADGASLHAAPIAVAINGGAVAA